MDVRELRVLRVLQANRGEAFVFGYRDRRGVVTTCHVKPVCLLQRGRRTALVAFWGPAVDETRFFWLDRIQAIKPAHEGTPPEVELIRIVPMGPVVVQSYLSEGERDE